MRAKGLGLVLILTSKIEQHVFVWTSKVPIFNPQGSAKRGMPAPSHTAKMNSKTDMLLLLRLLRLLLATRFEKVEHGPHI